MTLCPFVRRRRPSSGGSFAYYQAHQIRLEEIYPAKTLPTQLQRLRDCAPSSQHRITVPLHLLRNSIFCPQKRYNNNKTTTPPPPQHSSPEAQERCAYEWASVNLHISGTFNHSSASQCRFFESSLPDTGNPYLGTHHRPAPQRHFDHNAFTLDSRASSTH